MCARRIVCVAASVAIFAQSARIKTLITVALAAEENAMIEAVGRISRGSTEYTKGQPTGNHGAKASESHPHAERESDDSDHSGSGAENLAESKAEHAQGSRSYAVAYIYTCICIYTTTSYV